jgi:hypothetical protein
MIQRRSPPNLNRVIASQPRQVVDNLVVVLDSKLWRIWIGSNVQTKVVKRYVWKHCKSRKVDSGNRKILRRAPKSKASLIDQSVREIVNEGVRKQSLLARQATKNTGRFAVLSISAPFVKVNRT